MSRALLDTRRSGPHFDAHEGPMSMKFSKEFASQWQTQQWPTSIVRDRYGGIYSGGVWVAWPLSPSDLPTEPSDEDVPCRAFWLEHRSAPTVPVGLGDTPDEALSQLRAAIGGIAQG